MSGSTTNKKDIVSGWAASTSTEFNDEGEPLNGSSQAAADDAGEDINLDVIGRRLIGGKHKDRRDELARLESLAKKDAIPIDGKVSLVELVLSFVFRIPDFTSNEAIVSLVTALTMSDPEGQIVQTWESWAKQELQRVLPSAGTPSTTPISVYLVHLHLLALLDRLASQPTKSSSLSSLTLAMAQTLDVLVSDASPLKASIQKAAITRTRRVLRNNPTVIPSLLSSLVNKPADNTVPTAFAAVRLPLVGLIVDVCLHLRAKSETEKGAIGGTGHTYVEQAKEDIIELWKAAVLAGGQGRSGQTALNSFFSRFVTESEFGTLIPQVEKGFVRNPNTTFEALGAFVSSINQFSLAPYAQSKLLPLVLVNAKSAKPEVRLASVEFFYVLSQKINGESKEDQEARSGVADEILAVLKSGKTVSPEHRLALYSLVSTLPADSTISPKVSAVLPPLIAKETTSEPALNSLLQTLSPHLAATLISNIPVPAPSATVILKELASPKAITRKAVVACVGDVLWRIGQVGDGQGWTAEADKFAEGTSKVLADVSLKNVATAALTAVGGVGEGFMAAAVMLGPLTKSKSKAVATLLSTNPILQKITDVSPKPSFVLWDKAQRKVSSKEDEIWLLRALEAFIAKFEEKLAKDEAMRIQVGLAFIHLILASSNHQIRQDAIVALRSGANRRFKIYNRIVRDSLKAYFLSKESTPSKVVAEETEVNSETRAKQLLQILHTAVSFPEETFEEVKEDALVELVILAHHPELGSIADHAFVDLAVSHSISLARLVDRTQTRLLKLLSDNASVPKKSISFATASYRAAKSLAFISPEIFVPELMAKVRSDLDPQHLDFIGTVEQGIWATPPGSLFVDVLANKKVAPAAGSRATAAMDKWEQEVRESAAKKKAAAGNGVLSKQDQELIKKQTAVEDDVRAKISKSQQRMERGLALIRSLIEADVLEFKALLTETLQILLDGPLDKGSFLVGDDAFQTFLRLGDCCSSRLGLLRSFIGVAILRNYGVGAVPKEMQQEPLPSLVLRVLYRLRTLSEHSPFDSTSYAYITPLLTTVIAKGGLGGASSDSEEAMEQLALVLEIINFHCGEFSDTVFPRLSTIGDLIQLIGSQPALRKSAASALIELGDAIKDNAVEGEIAALIKGTLSQEISVRNASLQAIQPLDITELDYSSELWIACHDDDAQNARLARHLWEDNGLDVPDTFLPSLLPFIEHDNAYVRTSCAISFGEAIALHPGLISEVVVALEELYVERAKLLLPEFDEFGMIKEESLNRADPWVIRLAIAETFKHLSPLYTPEQIVPLFEFLIQTEALGDRSPEVRRGLLDAGIVLIDAHGHVSLGELIKVFETYLSQPSSGTEAGDHISEAVVILFGRLASHLDATDPRIPKVVDRLVEALKTPSEVVQAAVSDCIPALVKRMKSELPSLVSRLYDLLIHGEKYAERRGAAYGVAGVVKGRGLSALKEFSLIDQLTEAAKDKEDFKVRQGALLAFETLSATLGRLFEPYVVNILPLLLNAFGDTSADVREATQDASKVIMSRLSGHCVNIILPSLLEGLEEKQWRTKKGSIELLGSMAFCAPRQLALSLPTIIPELTAVLTDSHAQVRQAANASLKRFGEVIHNPEIKALVPTLLKALVDPTSKTNLALTSLLNTSFAHFIDSPSLALVAPIIERGLRERSATSKRKAVQILGNLSSLTDPNDFTPYLATFLPLVHIVLVDPVPEARATAAKALGTLVERLGEESFPDLVENLLQTLRTDTSGVDRQGAAQGLSEVLSGLGMERLEGLLPEVITNASSPRSYVREGFISLLVYLPTTFGHRFAPHLGRIISPILGGLADESEYVREASMRAGKMIISNYSTKAVDLLLPELEKGLADEKWRIRQSSVNLIGELLFRLTGISGKAEIEEEEGVDTGVADSSRKVLLEVLGQEKRDRVLSALYVVRQDAVGAVRTGSVHIWKALVQNTPKTLREILPSVINMVISLLSSPGDEQKETASRTLAELCKKNGERIMAEMVPILRSSVSSPDSNIRVGACLAFSEILENAVPAQLEEHEGAIIAGIRTALVDENAAVRAAAAQTFDALLQGEFGNKAIDQTIPTLLEALRQPGASSETALRALREIMTVRANSIFPVVIPTLITVPISAFNARALGSLVSVAGNALSRRLTPILTALVKSLETEKDEDIKAEVQETTKTLLKSVEDLEGINSLMMTLLGWAKGESPERRVSALQCFRTFCQVTEEDYEDYRIDWIRQLISLFADRQSTVVDAAWEALEAMVKAVPKDELEDLVIPLRSSIESTSAPGYEVPGFSRPKGAQSIVPILLAGVLGGTHDQREQAAGGIGDLVLRTSEAGIKPYIVQLTGPLIRVISSQTFPPAVKNAILATLTVLLQKVPHLVRPFQPQLQRTFVKSVADPASVSIRNHAAEGLGVLMISQTRVDPLITELVAGCRTSEPEIASSMAHALASVCMTAGKNLGAGSKSAIEELIGETFETPGHDAFNEAIARVVAGLTLYDNESAQPVFESLIFPSPPSPVSSQVILALANTVPTIFETLDVREQVVKKLLSSIAVFDNPSIARPAREARDVLKGLGDEVINSALAV
ncbi:Protein containing adaptin N-terminal region [Phaffia rhodozyma]|uniref:eIF-2-alpha kinase activator GCN1 n=1 Tax=Phaffia rhodozyma TaxID=264483 RepID=A0A0F7SIM3_PHARH|nr:Protein containing adaptin N-terminal region [Phaffia rhodozyma]